VLREQHHGEERDRDQGELLQGERRAQARRRPDEPAASQQAECQHERE
jgi:hypothetical protein